MKAGLARSALQLQQLDRAKAGWPNHSVQLVMVVLAKRNLRLQQLDRTKAAIPKGATLAEVDWAKAAIPKSATLPEVGSARAANSQFVFPQRPTRTRKTANTAHPTR